MQPPGEISTGRDSAERRFLTIVFVDLVGYTALSEELDPEDLGSLQRRYQDLTLAVMERYDGFVARFIGDGVLIYFGYPRAHEHDAERAVRAALELLQRMHDLDTSLHGRPMPRLEARIGIHSGLVVMAPDPISAGGGAPDVVGQVANLAARLQAEAPPGAVVISQDALELVEGLFECDPLGPHWIKGISSEVAVYRILRVATGAQFNRARLQRGATRMVGRQAALARLLTRWRSVASGSRSQIVALVGDAGVGKTRLVLEMCRQPELSDAAVVQLYCHEIFARTPLYPVGNFLLATAGLTSADGRDVRLGKALGFLDRLGLNAPENAEIFESLLGVADGDNATARTSTFPRRRQYDLAIAVVQRLTLGRPTVIWIEDTHWLDPSSAELLLELAAALTDAPLLLLLTMRTFPAGPALPDANEVVRLEQLDDRDCFELAKSVPGAEVLADDIIMQAVRAADGVPLFLEQLVISLMDERTHLPGRNRRLGGMPLLLAEMISERLDRLPGGRRIVQAAACIGRSFTPDFLLAILQEKAGQLAESLELLVNAEILRTRTYGSEFDYEFRHALIQKIAYESMVHAERRGMHGRIVEVLRNRNAARPTIPEVLAHHLTEAGIFTEAIGAWLQAGVAAAKRSAHVEAIDHLRKGVGLLEKVPDAQQRRQFELNLQVSLMASILASQGATSPRLSECCERGLQLCAQGAASPLVFPFVFGQFTYVNCRGLTDDAERLARLFLSLAERHANDSGRVIGHRMLGMVLLEKGKAATAREQLETSLNLYSPERDAATTQMFGQNTEVHTKSLLSLTLFCLGDVEAALEMGLDALRIADATRHPHSMVMPLCYVGGWVFGLCEATDHMMRDARRLIALADQHKLGGFRGHGLALLGWSLCQKGDFAQGIATMQQGIAALDSIDYRMVVGGYLGNLADAQRRVGKLRDAESSCARAIEMISQGIRWLEPELLRVEALIASELAPERPDNAAAMLRAATLLARQIAAPVMERRCLLSLNGLPGLPHDAEVSSRLDELSAFDNLDRRVDRIMKSYETEGSGPVVSGYNPVD
ncbi:MAG: AAA family ATPase [Casimicrobiaceae bacterium]